MNKDALEDVLTRGVAEVIPGVDVLREKLSSGKPLRIKFGIDPTSPHIHLGRAVLIRKLRDFQDLGHTIVFIIGDFTGVIGDTSDKESERPMLTREDVEQNLKTYFEQVGKILDMSKVLLHRNTEWLEKLTYREITEHADVFSVSDFIARDNIKRRLDQGKRVSLREVLYPLMQGYDSVAIQSDIEIGGTDQKFNLLSGRKLQEHFGQEPQGILTCSILEGLDGRKMSSSWGNGIFLIDSAQDMVGKIMSLRDELIHTYFVQATRVPLDTIAEYDGRITAGENPRDIKLILAEEVAALYHGREEAIRAREGFVATFQKKEIPEDLTEIQKGEYKTLGDLLVGEKIVESKTDWKRLIDDGAVKRLSEDSEEKIEDYKTPPTPGIYKIGKKRFVKVV